METSDYFTAKSRLHQKHLKVNENICKLNCNTVLPFYVEVETCTSPRLVDVSEDKLALGI